MKKCTSLLLTSIMFLSLFIFGGCGEKSDSPLVGNWAYIHDTETTIISLKSDGKAEYEGEKYSYTTDDTYINLTKDGESLKLRYELTKDGFLMYQTTEYEYQGDGTPESIIGNWYNPTTKWSYEFTEEGTFKEDGYFPGYFTVDENNSSIKLMYNDHFEDTIIYYGIEGTKLTIDYPWAMVKAE